MNALSTSGPDSKLDRLFDLLPAIHRIRDAEEGGPLRALLRVIAEQVDIVENDITQLYENWFIETCDEWVVPYIGDLLGYMPIHDTGELGEVNTPRGRARNRILIPRREVANIIRYRRRKGTLALLELLANDVAGWPARAVEFYKLLGWTQAINHQHLERGRTVDLRDGAILDVIGGPFEQSAHTIDVRRINSTKQIGRYNLSSIGIFVWRLKSYSVTRSPAYCLESPKKEEQGHFALGRYTFSILGNDIPLYARPTPETDPTDIAQELNLPTPIRRRPFEERKWVDGKQQIHASPKYYGWSEGNLTGPIATVKSLAIWAPGWPRKNSPQPIPYERIVPADLSGWSYRPRRGTVAVDPALGRIVFPENQLPEGDVKVYYHYAFSADLGGGEYDRPLFQQEQHRLYQVGAEAAFSSISEALRAWEKERPEHAIIEITDSDVYREIIKITFKAGHQTLQLRAANRARPVIRLLDYEAARSDFLVVRGHTGSRFVIDGLLVTGRGVELKGDIARCTIRHSTLVPGWSLESSGEPTSPGATSLMVRSPGVCVNIEHSILGTIQVRPTLIPTRDVEQETQEEPLEFLSDEEAELAECQGIARGVRIDPIPVCISDSILDATDTELEALGAPGCRVAHAVLNIQRSTVLGQVQVHAIALAENCIFLGRITVARRQCGCMRFCYITSDSRTPKRYQCQPDLAKQRIVSEVRDQHKTSSISEAQLKAEIQVAQQRECDRVRPQLNSNRYGWPSYCQLAETTASEITCGADDESEMGVFHDLYQPQRTENLRTRLEEYTPAGTQVGIIFMS